MKKAKLIRKKVLWLHGRLEQELGVEFEVERVKPRLYQFTCRGNCICLGYTQLQIGIFMGEDIPFSESNGFFLSREVDLVKQLLRYEYELEFPHRTIARTEKEIRKWKKVVELKIREIKKKVIIGGIQNVFGKRKDSQENKGVGKLHRRRDDNKAGKTSKPKRKKVQHKAGSRVRKPSDQGRKSGKRSSRSAKPIQRVKSKAKKKR